MLGVSVSLSTLKEASLDDSTEFGYVTTHDFQRINNTRLKRGAEEIDWDANISSVLILL